MRPAREWFLFLFVGIAYECYIQVAACIVLPLGSRQVLAGYMPERLGHRFRKAFVKVLFIPKLKSRGPMEVGVFPICVLSREETSRGFLNVVFDKKVNSLGGFYEPIAAADLRRGQLDVPVVPANLHGTFEQPVQDR